MTQPSFTQVTFRLRYDNGSESAATWRANENTNATINVDENLRVRFRIDETASRAWTNKIWNIYYNLNGAGYAAVTASTPIQFSASSNFADGADCTTQLTGGSGTFVTDNNGMKETTGGATNSGTAGYLFEVEWCLKMDSAQVANADTITLYVRDGTAEIASYSNTPTITASKIAISKTESISVTDTPTIDKLLINLSASESIGVTDTPTVEFPPEPAREVSVSDTITAADTVTMDGVPNISAEETINVGDTPAVELEGLVEPWEVSQSESITVTDGPRYYPDEIIVYDQATVSLVVDISTSDSITVADTPTVELVEVAAYSINVSETINVTDTSAVLLSTKEINTSDSITVSDTPEVEPLEIAVSISETVTVADTPTVFLPELGGIDISVSETITVSDAITLDGVPNISVSDTVNVADTPNVVLPELGTFYINVNEAINVTDTPALVKSISEINVSETVTVTDAPAVIIPVNISVSQSITVADSATITPLVINANVSQSITVTDTPTVVMAEAGAITISVGDTVTVADSVTIAALQIDCIASESITVADAATMAGGTNVISVSESIAVSDSPLLSFLFTGQRDHDTWKNALRGMMKGVEVSD